MKSVDTGKEKVKKICEVLRKETIDPAKKEGDQMIAKARVDGEKIIAQAKKEVSRMIEEAKKKIQEERNVFQASINLACKKSIDSLKQDIEQKLFNPELSSFVKESMKDPKVGAALIMAVIEAIEKGGIDGDLHALVAEKVDVEAINQQLAQGILEKLTTKGVEIGEIDGGIQVKILDRNLTIDLSTEALKTLVARFVRDDFRSVIFAYE